MSLAAPPIPLQAAAPAKINLGLHVLRRRSDGYHDIETAFLRIPWADALSVQPAGQIFMTCSDPGLPTDEGNLCVRAARRLAAACNVTTGAAIHLEKHLPYGGGLGGGSSDAATTLRLLLELWGLAPVPELLHHLAAGLGADVPFFLGPPAALGTGRGDVLTPLTDSEGAPYTLPYVLVIVVPPVAVPTPDAYRMVTPRAAGRPDLRAVVCSNDLEMWCRLLVNDFELPVCAAYPAIGAARALLLDAGARYAALSGSGSAVFGVFDDEARATAAAESARYTGHQVWQGTL